MNANQQVSTSRGYASIVALMGNWMLVQFIKDGSYGVIYREFAKKRVY